MPASTEPRRVLAALSGGVDSSVCVLLLQQQGFQVEAVVLDLFPAARETVEAAQESARALGVKLHVVKRHEAFEERVILPFCQAYREGRTPNPCVMCNPSTKFFFLLEAARELGFDRVATGHYAAIQRRQGPAGEQILLKKADFLPRDQSYMLYRLSQEALGALVLPLQHLSKDQVRALAAQAGLACAAKPDSQEICFIPDHDYPAYIERRFGPMPQGDFIAPDGSVCGRHKGILYYTVGQRKGLGVALGKPVFVTRIDPASNRIYLAHAGDEYAPSVLLEDCVIHPAAPGEAFRAGVKIRSMAQPVPALVTLLPESRAKVEFDTPQRAPAPGQSAVWYDGDVVLGGGIISLPG